MKRALIQGNDIIEIVAVGADFPVHESMSWVDVADDTVAREDTYSNGAVVKYTEPPLTWLEIRQQRNALLAASDYTQVADAPGDTAAWATYRQALRDVPTATSPDDVVWPTEPN
jgi:hypothetical protein